MTIKENIQLFELWYKSKEAKEISFEISGRCKTLFIAINKKSKHLSLEGWASSGTVKNDSPSLGIKISKLY